ncbi:hypothetical protein [Nonomuraea guangzhouensis]|uniref:AAA+ ATPase domain-containing protein n=1 Tax=Nonomuraea guangzhouensis TaxID=1291555 RepID=A0ABW4GHF0_9ACTN|nr:hypothetical protein [Nonomuraea guangzhouensis]
MNDLPRSDSFPEQLGALRELVTPGLYRADLEHSPLLRHPAVLSRAGKGASQQARVRVLIAVLEEVTERQLRASDQVAARMLFALGEWAGRAVTERHRAVAKLRNPHWSWERNYRKEPLTRDLTMILRALGRLAPDEDQPAPVATAQPVTELSDDLVRTLGRRRTAYPLDMSLHELRRAALLVETRIVRYHDQQGPVLTLDIVAEALAQGRSVLLLGEPGAGKSVALFELVQRGLTLGLHPFPVRARDHRELLSRAEWPELSNLPGAVLFLDGLDEAAAEREHLARGLRELLRLRPALVTSRRREYEHELSPLILETEFDEIYVLAPWRVEVEFDDYLRRLTGAGLLAESSLMYGTVTANDDLSHLVTRPLYARMLTFIGEHAARDVAGPAALYGEYLTKLARVAESSAGIADSALQVWRAAAWAVHSAGAAAQNAIALGDFLEVLPGDLGGRTTRRLLDLILEIRTVQGIEVGEFRHYSFFEYLVARHVRDVLVGRPDAESVNEVLRHDLTREIRHHLVVQLRAVSCRTLRDTLVGAYRVARSGAVTPQAQAVCNLLIYLLSRTIPQSVPVLEELLDGEDNLFLSAAIQWALCHRGASGMDGRFFEQLERDPVMRAQCRGYVLYYYGDMDATMGPPYTDESPYRPCVATLRQIMGVFERSTTIEKVPGPRRAIDLFTFMDILLVRRLTLPREGFEELRRIHDSLRDDEVDAKLWARLAQMLEMLRPL